MSSTLLDAVDQPRLAPPQPLRAPRVSALVKLLVIVTAAYLLTASALLRLDFTLPVPWGFLPFLGLVAFPLGYALFAGHQWLQGRVNAASPLIPTLMPLLGVAVVWWLFHCLTLWFSIPLLAFALVHLFWQQRGSLLTLAGTILVVFFGCGAVWNLNYLIAFWAGDRLYDPWLMDVDLWCYSLVFGTDVVRTSLFPICRHDLAYALLERSYHFYFVEFFAVLFVGIGRGKDVPRLLGSLFFLYFIGLTVFALLPTIGPFTFYPDSIDPAYHGTATYYVMQQIVQEYEAVRSQSPLNGFGYFIALPSLHVAKALLLQLWLRGSPLLFWFFLPANILMALSTFLLGYHYLIDFPAGIALTLVVCTVWKRYWPAPIQSPIQRI